MGTPVSAPEWMPTCDLPEDAVIEGALMVVAFLDSNLERMYAVGTKGELALTSYLGLTVLAQHDIIAGFRAAT